MRRRQLICKVSRYFFCILYVFNQVDVNMPTDYSQRLQNKSGGHKQDELKKDTKNATNNLKIKPELLQFGLT